MSLVASLLSEAGAELEVTAAEQDIVNSPESELVNVIEAAQVVFNHDEAISRMSTASTGLESLLLANNDSIFNEISLETIYGIIGYSAESSEDADKKEDPTKKKGLLNSIVGGISKALKKLWDMVVAFFSKLKSFFTGQDKKIDAAIEAVKAGDDTHVSHGEAKDNLKADPSENKHSLKLGERLIKVPNLFNVKGSHAPTSLKDVSDSIASLLGFGKAMIDQLDKSHSLFDSVLMDIRQADKSATGSGFDSKIAAAMDKLNNHEVIKGAHDALGFHAGGIKIEVTNESSATRVVVNSAELLEAVEIKTETRNVVAFLEEVKKLNSTFVAQVVSRVDRMSNLTSKLVEMLDSTVDGVIKEGLQNRISAIRKVSGVIVIILRGDTSALVKVSQTTARVIAAATSMTTVHPSIVRK